MEIFPEVLAEGFLKVARQIRRETQARMTPLGLNLHESRALRMIDQAGPLRPSDLADRLGIVARSATDSVAGLVAAGLAERHTDPADGRAQLLVLSPKGTEVLAEVTRIRRQVAAEVFGRLDPEQRSLLSGLLDHLTSP
ncbi:MAG: MarR family transcriptional regulator [Actinobacteria bacterium]|nr:MarR family transcriptional regulator [Actinomycetota bacterium]